jgi:acyl dehydratase
VSRDFNSMEVGQTVAGEAIVVTDAHFAAAAELFRDHHPIHQDDLYARERGHPSRTLPGSMIAGIMSSALAAMLSEHGLALLEYTVNYKAPVYEGDTLRSTCVITRTVPKPHRGGGLAFLETSLRNQDDVLVAVGHAVDLVAAAEAE